jgi:Family of unknown function (DUF695)
VRQTLGVVIFGRRRERDPKVGIAAFWTWWSGARHKLDAALTAGEFDGIQRLLSGRVAAIHPDLAWEVTRGRIARNALVLSPEGSPSLRTVTERWLRAGPGADEEWEYHPARQADLREFASEFQLGRRLFDPGKARFGTEVDHDRARVHVLVHHPDFPHLDDADRLRASFLMLDWALGEDDVERWLGEIRVTGASQPHDVNGVRAVVSELAREYGRDDWTLMEGIDDRGRVLEAQVRVPFPRMDYPLFDLHGAVRLRYRAGDDGLPGDDESAVLDGMTQGLLGRLGSSAVLAGVVTTGGLRSLHLYADHEGVVPGQVEAWAAQQPRQVDVQWTPDPGWEILRALY